MALVTAISALSTSLAVINLQPDLRTAFAISAIMSKSDPPRDAPSPAAHRQYDGVFFYVFGLIELNGDDLRGEPLEVRKARSPRPGEGRYQFETHPRRNRALEGSIL